MTEAATGQQPQAQTRAPERLNLPYHLIIGVAIGIVAPFTLWAWPIAILLGIVIGSADVERRNGIKASAATGAVRVLAVTGGVLGMLLAGALIGGLIAFLIVALAAFSERVAAGTSSIDRGIARILITIVAVAIWFMVIVVLKLNLSISIGG
jgi:hypothetical protein